MKTLSLIAFLCFSTSTVHASQSMSLTCEGSSSLQTCTKRVTDTLTKLGCNLDHQETVCKYFLEQNPANPTGPGIPTETIECNAYAANCEKPNMGLLSDSCDPDSKLVKIPKSAKLHNGYWYGFFGSNSRGLCIRN